MSTAAFYSGEDEPERFVFEPYDMTTLTEGDEADEKWIMFYADRLIWQTEQALVKACEGES
jgi:hypothetical protein